MQALQSFTRGLPQTGLKDVVVGIDPELDKHRGGPAIGQIVKHALAKGLVEATPFGHVNPVVRIANRQSSAGHIHTDGKAEGTTRESQGDIVPIEDPVNLPPNSTADDDPSRLKRFHDQLRQGDLGPFSSQRTALFDEVERFVENGTLTANRVVKKAARFINEAKASKVPHSVSEKFLLTVAGCCPMFLDDKGDVLDPNSPTSFGRVVAKVVPNWRDAAEAELIRYLVEKMGDLHTADLETVAYALFRTLAEDERLDRTEQLVAKLIADGRIAHTGGKFISVKDQSPHLTVVHPPEITPECDGLNARSV